MRFTMYKPKKVAILLPWLKMGGTNKIALHFMKELSQYCDVTLILSQKTGELLELLPENIHLIVDEMQDFKSIFLSDLQHLRLPMLWKDVVYYARIKSHHDHVDNYRYLVRRNDWICSTEFDCAISYHGQSPERLLNLLDRIHAKKKVAWIHGEFNNPPEHYRRMERHYAQLDHVFFVSNHTMQSFFDKMTVPREKCTVYHNPLDRQEVLTKAALPCETGFSPERINLLTVGRISQEKGQDMIPAITRTLLDAGHPVCWYLIGDGDNRPMVEEKIREYGVESQVRLLGTQQNPYPYMKACDIYVQPSYTEGYSTTICEAGMLGKAIVGTKPSGGIRDQITDGEDGLIVDATVAGLAGGIQKLIEDGILCTHLGQSIQKKDFEGKDEIQKFLQLL